MVPLKSAIKFLEGGYNVIPVHKKTKLPIVDNWMQYQKQAMDIESAKTLFDKDCSIGLLTGGKSRVLCVDVDCKYDLSGDLFERFCDEIPREILAKAYKQTTRNGGYHIVAKVPEQCLFGNERLAARPTTSDERHAYYMEMFKDFTKKENALKVACGDTMRVLIETRSGTADQCGGYFLIAPSEGYKPISGKIQEWSEEECNNVLEIARSFNQVKGLHQPLIKNSDIHVNWEITPLDDYNEKADVVGLLEDHGWEGVGGSGDSVRFKRPGHTYAPSSAIYDEERRIFNCFTTSTAFETGKGYDPVGVFSVLEADGNITEAYKKLIQLGYGKKK